MWLGLYLIALTLIIFGHFFSYIFQEENNAPEQFLANLGYAGFAVGVFLLPLITIAYGISLIVNG